MNKEPKKTILKTIELFFKGHKEEEHKDPEIKNPTKRSILGVIDKPENIADRTTNTTFPVPSEPIMNEASTEFKTNKPDYKIADLTKKEDMVSTEVQPPIENDFNINTILNNLDERLDENDCKHVLNILTTRSSKDVFRESALVEFTIYDRSYIMSLIVEKEEDKYKYQVKSSYGKEIYSKTVDANKLNETIYYPFKAIVLRDKFLPVLNEAANKETISNAAATYILDRMKEEEFDPWDSYEVVEDAIKYLEDKFGDKITRDQEKEIRKVFFDCLEKDMKGELGN